MGKPITTIIGNLTNDPELRFTPSGAAVATFTVAANDRYLDKATSEWKDGDTSYFRCTVWRQYAENVAESLSKGQRVIVHGSLGVRTYETRDGEKRTSVEVEVHDVGPALKYGTAVVSRTVQAQGMQGFGGTAPADDPWANQSAEAPF